MKKLAWIGHYSKEVDIFRFNNFNSNSQVLKNIFVNLNKRLSPYVFATLENKDKGIELHGIICPYMPRQIASSDGEKQLLVIKKAIELCNRLNVKQIGLAGLFASLWENGDKLKQITNIPVTTGKNLIAILVIGYISHACAALNRDMKDLNLGIIGYNNRISKIFAEYYKNTFGGVLVDNKDEKAENPPGVKKVSRQDIFKNADVIIVTVMGFGLESCIPTLKAGAIVCDIVVPFYLASEISKKRQDVLAFEGIWSRYEKLEGYTGRGRSLFSDKVFPACVAELIILAAEKKIGDFSLSDNINVKNTLAMKDMSLRNGFEFFGFKTGNKVYSESELGRIQNAFEK